MSQAVRHVELRVFEEGFFASQTQLGVANAGKGLPEADRHLILKQHAEFLEVAAGKLLPGAGTDRHPRVRIGTARGMNQVLADAEPAILRTDIELRQKLIAGQ